LCRADLEPGIAESVLHGAGTILVVEDEAFVREVLGEILRSAGYRVLVARNAAEARIMFHHEREGIQLLLTDVVLPDRNGCDLASEFAPLRRGLKTMFISGYPENAVTRKGSQHSEWLYLPKPFSGTSLIQKVAEALQGGSI
jgi:two-component system, cell cycle sensor histidine kinase and response regulator CckA